jgi:hypothetical protein
MFFEVAHPASVTDNAAATSRMLEVSVLMQLLLQFRNELAAML